MRISLRSGFDVVLALGMLAAVAVSVLSYRAATARGAELVLLQRLVFEQQEQIRTLQSDLTATTEQLDSSASHTPVSVFWRTDWAWPGPEETLTLHPRAVTLEFAVELVVVGDDHANYHGPAIRGTLARGESRDLQLANDHMKSACVVTLTLSQTGGTLQTRPPYCEEGAVSWFDFHLRVLP